MINFKRLWQLRTVSLFSSLWVQRQAPNYKSISYFNVRYMSESSIDEANTGVPNPKDPFGRVLKSLKTDMQNLSKGNINIPDHQYFPYFCDVAIIGGGIMGSSIAYWLQQRVNAGMKIVVIERDPTYEKASTVLSVGGIRQQFSLPENVQMSLFGAEFLRDIKRHLDVEDYDLPDIKFTPHGYLLLAPESGVDILRENYAMQKELGARVDLLTPQQLKSTFPWLNTDGISLASYGYGNEGWFDPYSLLMAFKRKAKSLGTFFIKGDVTGFKFREIDGIKVIDEDGERRLQKITKILVKTDEDTKEISPSLVIFAAGHQSGEIGKLAQIGFGPGVLKTPIPVEPRKRYVYVIHCPDGPSIDCPLVVDSNGVYFRKEGLGGNYLCGRAPDSHEEEPDCDNLDVDHSFFENKIWPSLAHRVPRFESIKVAGAWAGYYDYNYFDQNAIIGLHPFYPNLYLATGFSGHGLQQAPAVGRAIMELIIDNDFKTIDLERFSFNRIVNSNPIFEKNIF